MKYRFRDWVVYDPGYREPQIGRVVGPKGSGSTLVCYHQGCTAAATQNEYLRPATPFEIASAPDGIGFHRFDHDCPVYEPGICTGCWVDVLKGMGER